MRALLFDRHIQYTHDYPCPQPKQGEALIRVEQAGICSTDLQLVKGYMGFEGVLGHEFVGIVKQSDSQPDLIGARVVGEINAACENCPTCQAGSPTHCPHRTTLGIDRRDGAFADYLTLPTQNLHVVPEEISSEKAVFVEPLAAACQILQQIHVRPTDRVMVIGDGKLGLLCAQVLRLTGCRLSVLGRHEDKMAHLAQQGIHVSTTPDTLPDQTDIIIEATGTPEGFRLAAGYIRPRGTIVLKSTYHEDMTCNMTDMVIREVTIIGSRCGPFSPALDLLRKNLVDVAPLIDATYSLEHGVEALERASTKGALKVLLKM